MPTIYDEIASLVTQQREILDRADAAGRDLTAEETGQYERLEAVVQEKEIVREQQEKAAVRRKQLESRELSLRSNPPSRPQLSKPAAGGDGEELENVRMDAFRSYLLHGGKTAHMAPKEFAALQMDSDTGGGTLVMPEQFVARLIDGLDEMLALRAVSTTFRVTNAESLGAPSLDNDPADDTWTSEILTGSADTTMSFGKRSLSPHPLAKRILVSKTLIRRSGMMVDQIVRQRLLFKMGVTQEKGFLTGHGAGQPLGVFTASANGISTGRDISTANTTTEITADGLINCKYNLKEQYLRSANLRWVFHRDAIKMIRKFKDGEGQYLWGMGLAGDRQPTICDTPYIVSEFAPSTFTSGSYVGIIGDFSYYWIADALDATIAVAQELYMATNQDGYFIRSETDGMPVLEEAFSRVKLA